MVAILAQRKKSGNFSANADSASDWGKLSFEVLGTKDDGEVYSLCLAGLPATYMGLFLQGFVPEHQGAGVWYVEASYSPLPLKKPGESTYGFDTSAKTEHVTISKETYDSGRIDLGPAPDYQGLIGVNGDSVEGVDVFTPTFGFTETHYLPAALVTGAYKLLLFKLTARCNDGPWKGLARREALFLGASGSLRGVEAWEISYKFAGSPNAEDVPIGNSGATAPFKFGWDYLWIRYKEKVDANAKAFVRQPDAWYIERVYDEAQLGDLGIGS